MAGRVGVASSYSSLLALNDRQRELNGRKRFGALHVAVLWPLLSTDRLQSLSKASVGLALTAVPQLKAVAEGCVFLGDMYGGEAPVAIGDAENLEWF